MSNKVADSVKRSVLNAITMDRNVLAQLGDYEITNIQGLEFTIKVWPGDPADANGRHSRPPRWFVVKLREVM